MSVDAIRAEVPHAPVHSWLRAVHVAHVPGPSTPLLDEVVAGITDAFTRLGHTVSSRVPRDPIDGFLTTARYSEPVHWRDSLLLTGRRRYGLDGSPTTYTLVHLPPARFEGLRRHFERVLAKPFPERADYDFPGLAERAHHVLFEQGRRGGPLLGIARLLQAQTVSLRVIAVVGDRRPERFYHFDLVGGHACVAGTARELYEDTALRIATVLNTRELTAHQSVGEPVPRALWRRLSTVPAMLAASRALGQRRFFTRMVRVSDVVDVPVLTTALFAQYSEGCFATWEPALDALLGTVTGSSTPVDKGNLSESDLAVIVDVAPDGSGVRVRPVEGLPDLPPSSEAVELRNMDAALPQIELPADWGIRGKVPVVRSKLHGHRGVQAFDPNRVEFVPLDEPYHHYPVSCSTEAQMIAVRAAFSRARCLRDPGDPRQIAFTVLPGHGVLLAEKWVHGTQPFEILIEAMDSGAVEISDHVAQGVFDYVLADDRRCTLRETQNGKP